MSGILEYVFLCVWLFYVNFVHVEVKCVSRKKPKIRLNIFLSNGTCHLDNMVLLTSNDITSILRAKRISKEILRCKICGGVRNCFILGGRVEGRDCTPFSYKLNAAINFVKIICRFLQTFNDKRRPFSPISVCFLRGPRWLPDEQDPNFYPSRSECIADTEAEKSVTAIVFCQRERKEIMDK